MLTRMLLVLVALVAGLASAQGRKLQQLTWPGVAPITLPPYLQGLVSPNAFGDLSDELEDASESFMENEGRLFGSPGAGIPILGTVLGNFWDGIFTAGGQSVLDTFVDPVFTQVGK